MSSGGAPLGNEAREGLSPGDDGQRQGAREARRGLVGGDVQGALIGEPIVRRGLGHKHGGLQAFEHLSAGAQQGLDEQGAEEGLMHRDQHIWLNAPPMQLREVGVRGTTRDATKVQSLCKHRSHLLQGAIDGSDPVSQHKSVPGL